MNALKKILKSNALWAVVAAAFLILVWHIACVAVSNEFIVPSIGDTLLQFFTLFGSQKFYSVLGKTLLRTLLSFAISFVLAAALAALSAVSRQFRATFACIISVIRTLPTMAITLMLLIWTNARVAPSVVTALVSFPMIYSQFMAAIDGVDGDILEMAKLYRVSERDKLTKIILPAVAPEVVAQTGAGLSLGLKVMVSAEVLCYTLDSLGGMMQQARLFAEMPLFAALTAMCILLGLILELFSSLLKSVVGRWRVKEGGDAH